MTKNKDISDPVAVDAYIARLDAGTAEAVREIRSIILSASPLVSEHIKWNSPAFFYNGEMKPFDPKEYKRDIAVLNLHRGRMMIVLPTGARISDDTGILEGKYTDGRRIINFTDTEEVKNKSDALKSVITKWIAGVEES